MRKRNTSAFIKDESFIYPSHDAFSHVTLCYAQSSSPMMPFSAEVQVQDRFPSAAERVERFNQASTS